MARFIKKKFEVQDPQESKTYKHSSEQDRSEFELSISNIFFIGLRASGKTTLAKKVAQELQAEFVDTDDLVEQKAGQNIAELVNEQGWEHFRQLEHQVLQEVCSQKGQVVATGGGIVLRDENRELLQCSGQVFYLMADVLDLAARLENAPEKEQRPALTDKSLKEEIVQNLGEREPYYVLLADHVLQAEKSPEELAEDVFVALQMQEPKEED
jgi:shikimate kinase